MLNMKAKQRRGVECTAVRGLMQCRAAKLQPQGSHRIGLAPRRREQLWGQRASAILVTIGTRNVKSPRQRGAPGHARELFAVYALEGEPYYRVSDAVSTLYMSTSSSEGVAAFDARHALCLGR